MSKLLNFINHSKDQFLKPSWTLIVRDLQSSLVLHLDKKVKQLDKSEESYLETIFFQVTPRKILIEFWKNDT